MLPSRPLRRATVAIALALLVSGCSNVTKKIDGVFGGETDRPIACPTTGMLREGASLVRYRPNSAPDLTNVQLAAKILDVSPACILEPDPRQISMVLGVRVLAERGPAAPAGAEQKFAYLVAITNASRQILSRQVYPLAASFEGTARQAGFEEVLELKLPLSETRTPDDYRIYVSLLLQPGELPPEVGNR